MSGNTCVDIHVLLYQLPDMVFIEFSPVDDVSGRIDNDPATAWRYDLGADHLPDHIL